MLSHPAPHFPWQGPGDRDKPIEPKKKSWQQGDRETYVAMVESLDRGIGRTMAALERWGLAEQTLVVFCSDNGGHTYSRNAPFSGSKATLWEGGLRVPCLARWPGVIPAGRTFTQPCITMDWSATLRRLAGLPADPDREDGVDLLPALTGEAALPHDRALCWRRKSGPRRKVSNPGRAIRRGHWKLLEESDRTSLFHLSGDVAERNNLAAEHPDLVADLRGELDAWERRVAPESAAVKAESERSVGR
jgi:arylsulfatase A-like enzyme